MPLEQSCRKQVTSLNQESQSPRVAQSVNLKNPRARKPGECQCLLVRPEWLSAAISRKRRHNEIKHTLASFASGEIKICSPTREDDLTAVTEIGRAVQQ